MGSGSVPDSFLVHTGMEIVHADHTLCTLVGADEPAELIGQSLTDIVAPGYHAQLCEQVARIENENVPVLGLAVELQTFRGQPQRTIMVSRLTEWDGARRVQTTVLPVIEDDSPAGYLLRTKAIDEAPIGITISDPSQPDNPIVYVNDGFCELTGYPRDEILGQNCRFLQGDATREEPVAEMRDAIEAEEPVTVTLRNYRKDGSMFWNRVVIVPIRSDAGRITNFLGYQQDVTAEKRFEQDLTLFKEQAAESDRAIFVTSRDGTIQYVNPAFERMTGYSATEAVGRSPRLLKSGRQDEAFYADLWAKITAGEVWESELTNQTKHGEFFEVRQKIIPITDTDGEITHFVAIEQDITEKKLTTQTLDVLNRVLRHNLRNSLSVIDGHAELMEAEEMDATARQASIDAIRRRARSMQKIVDKTEAIRDAWNPSEDKQTWEHLDIRALIDEYRRQYPEADITARLGSDDTIQVRNAALFKQAINEAVENAVRHTDESSPDITISVQRDSEAGQVHLCVADTGTGIPEFEREVLESNEETPLHHSLGVGLWLMRWISTALGGELEITDNEPQGSVVTFQLPATDGLPADRTS